MRYTYFPGCSLKSSEGSYENSIKLACHALGIQLDELEDWNCCGATVYPGLKKSSYLILAGRNLALAEKYGRDIVTPCNGCYASLKKAERYFQENPGARENLNSILKEAGLSYHGKSRIRHFLDILIDDIGIEKISDSVTRRLSGQKVACYYGCQYSRPFGVGHPEDPRTLERLFTAMGAEVVDFSSKTNCCGGMLVISEEKACLGLIRDILDEAKRLKNADYIVTICPLCQINLELYQRKAEISIPIVYFTQILCYSFGIEISSLGKEISPLRKIFNLVETPR